MITEFKVKVSMPSNPQHYFILRGEHRAGQLLFEVVEQTLDPCDYGNHTDSIFDQFTDHPESRSKKGVKVPGYNSPFDVCISSSFAIRWASNSATEWGGIWLLGSGDYHHGTKLLTFEEGIARRQTMVDFVYNGLVLWCKKHDLKFEDLLHPEEVLSDGGYWRWK